MIPSPSSTPPSNQPNSIGTAAKWGVPPDTVDTAIGHDKHTADKNYTKIEPPEAGPPEWWDRDSGENFADLFARLCPEPETLAASPHSSPHSGDEQQSESAAVAMSPISKGGFPVPVVRNQVTVGRRTRKQEPAPGSEVTLISPP